MLGITKMNSNETATASYEAINVWEDDRLLRVTKAAFPLPSSKIKLLRRERLAAPDAKVGARDEPAQEKGLTQHSFVFSRFRISKKIII